MSAMWGVAASCLLLLLLLSLLPCSAFLSGGATHTEKYAPTHTPFAGPVRYGGQGRLPVVARGREGEVHPVSSASVPALWNDDLRFLARGGNATVALPATAEAVPLFFVREPLLPGQRKGANIFEQRYKNLIDQHSQIGLVFNRTLPGEVGGVCAAGVHVRIVSREEHYKGTNATRIVMEGLRRFDLLTLAHRRINGNSTNAYPMGLVRFENEDANATACLEDEVEVARRVRRLGHAVIAMRDELLGPLPVWMAPKRKELWQFAEGGDGQGQGEEDPEAVCWQVARLLPLSARSRQLMLQEARCVRRLEAVERALEGLARRYLRTLEQQRGGRSRSLSAPAKRQMRSKKRKEMRAVTGTENGAAAADRKTNSSKWSPGNVDRLLPGGLVSSAIGLGTSAIDILACLASSVRVRLSKAARRVAPLLPVVSGGSFVADAFESNIEAIVQITDLSNTQQRQMDRTPLPILRSGASERNVTDDSNLSDSSRSTSSGMPEGSKRSATTRGGPTPDVGLGATPPSAPLARSAPAPVNTGSGLVVGSSTRRALILTNSHVCGHSSCDVVSVSLYDGRNIPGRILKRWENCDSDEWNFEMDFAVIEVQLSEGESEGDSEPLQCVKLGNSDTMRVGDFVIVVGNPRDLRNVATLGIASCLLRPSAFESGGEGIVPNELLLDRGVTLIATDAQYNKGVSGGPLLNAQGAVVGLNTFVQSYFGGPAHYSGLGFAIAINRVREAVEDFLEAEEAADEEREMRAKRLGGAGQAAAKAQPSLLEIFQAAQEA